mmetsp:Transcript_13447/g.24054  ORF Transcript_13447/g.24054 Transcript_13447/m.24054 type:complete len:219 (-) Transcript_13447:8-664(-)
MFRGRAANPCSNKFLYMKHVQHCQQLHRDRLQTMKPAIDNKPPKKPTHLTNNKKREQMLEDRFIRIERENRMLLERMSSIMQKKGLDNDSRRHQVKSLNKSYRKKELQRITQENQNILRRIQHSEPNYSYMQWEEDRRNHEQYMKNICEYPYQKQKKQKNSKKQKKKRQGMNNSRSGLIPSLDSEYKKQSYERLNKNASYSDMPESASRSNALEPLNY